jgi:hypothetical protein
MHRREATGRAPHRTITFTILVLIPHSIRPSAPTLAAMRRNHERSQDPEQSALNTCAGAIAIENYSHLFFQQPVRLFWFAIAIENY